MNNLKYLICLLILLSANAFDIFPLNQEFTYKLETDVTLVPDYHATADSMWYLNGLIKVQRRNESVLAVKIELSKHTYPDQESTSAILEPFLVRVTNESVYAVLFKETEPIWSSNIKRAIASLLQAKGDSPGAYVVNEDGIYGTCPTEHYVVNKTNTLYEISKTYDMESCIPYSGAIYLTRSNIPLNFCVSSKQTQAITSRIANYKLKKLDEYKYMLEEVDSTMRTNVRTFESYYPQFLFTRVLLKYESHKQLDEVEMFDVSTGMSPVFSALLYVSPEEATGGRSPRSPKQLVKRIAGLLNSLADDSMETAETKLKEPYDETVSEIVRLMGTMDLDGLKKLYDEIDIGTSYRQETSRNILLEIIPRTGTAATVLLTRDLILGKHVLPSTAVQLLIALPFYTSEPSTELVKMCEDFLILGADRPDVKHAAVLSYATMIYNTFTAGKMSLETFEKYVKTYFDLFLNSFDYEEQMLYLEALGNLQIGNVAEYLDPIIKADYPQNTDIRFLAMWATMPTAHTRPDKIYETYWPIFHSKTTPLQLRVAAFTMLLVSNPTPGRLLGLYSVIRTENDPHLINFYRTTVLSISETTYPCYQHLKQLLAYMTRQLPKAPLPKYWVTGNYLFDYRDRKFHIGSMLQTLLIGSHKTDLPMVAYVKFDTEALGRFTGQLGFYIKARGLTDAIISRFVKMNADHLKMDQLANILKKIKMPVHSTTPLHLELILQIEGKAVLSYHLNQTTFYTLTDGDLINRIQSLLKGNSHINMQLVRRPFMIKYALPTLIGTPADILIESTVAATIRGSTTQQMVAEKISRNHQIDVRYSSYAVVKIRSYNPIENIEYSTIREQGFLVYLPINNEIVWNISSKSVSYSFYRPEGLTSGISLKSRTRNTPSKSPAVVQDANEKEISHFTRAFDDLGIDVHVGIHKDYTKENVVFMLETDVLDNAKVLSRAPFSLINNLLKVVSLIQLNTIHIGRDKHLTLLLKNEKKTKLEGTLRWETEDLSKQTNVKENKITTLDWSMAHKVESESTDVKALHKWEVTTKYTNFKNSDASKIAISLNRKHLDGSKWKLCVSANHDPLILLKKPFSFTSTVVFGNSSSTKKCPTDRSRVDFNITFGVQKNADKSYASLDTHDESCPKEIIRLSPPPFSGYCDSNIFSDLTSVTNYDVRFKFERMPPWFDDATNRIDHLISAVVPNKIDKLNITDNFKMSIRMPTNDTKTYILINHNEIVLPFNWYIDAKSRSFQKNSIDYGFTSGCSIVNSKMYTLFNQIIYLTNEIKENYTLDDSFLLAAECSDSPKLAVFMLNDKNGIKIYNGGNYLTFKTGQAEPVIEINGGEKVNLRNTIYQYPPDEDFYDFRVYLDEENILIVENQLLSAIIQFDMKNIVSILIPTIHKGRMCGLCSLKT